MTRIRYQKEGSVLTSTKIFLCGVTPVKAVIHLDAMKCQIIDAVSQKCLAEENAGSVHSLKEKAKKLARNLGATFYDEVRKNKIVLTQDNE